MQHAIYVPLLDDDDGDTAPMVLCPHDLACDTPDPALSAGLTPELVLLPNQAASDPILLPHCMTEVLPAMPESLLLVPQEDTSLADSPTCDAPVLAAAESPVGAPAGTQIIVSAHGSMTTSSKQIEWAATASAKYGGNTVVVTWSGHNVWPPAHLNLLSSVSSMLAMHVLHMLLQLCCMDHKLNLVQHTTTVPHTFKEVLASDQKEQWLVVMRSEINVLMTNDIFDLVMLLAGCQAISMRWVLKLKALEVFKACFVVCSFLQKAGIDFDDMYALVLWLENLCLLLVYVVMNGYVVHSMDVNNAFLQGTSMRKSM
jgi:hypothetical protein